VISNLHVHDRTQTERELTGKRDDGSDHRSWGHLQKTPSVSTSIGVFDTGFLENPPHYSSGGSKVLGHQGSLGDRSLKSKGYAKRDGPRTDIP
jgi:hypothetical protein